MSELSNQVLLARKKVRELFRMQDELTEHEKGREILTAKVLQGQVERASRRINQYESRLRKLQADTDRLVAQESSLINAIRDRVEETYLHYFQKCRHHETLTWRLIVTDYDEMSDAAARKRKDSEK